MTTNHTHDWPNGQPQFHGGTKKPLVFGDFDSQPPAARPDRDLMLANLENAGKSLGFAVDIARRSRDARLSRMVMMLDLLRETYREVRGGKR